MRYKDYYQILSVEKNATQSDIKRSYKKLARKYHPDVSKDANAETKFKELGEAYEVLKDPEKRAAYDQLGSNWQSGQDFQPPPNWDAGFEFTGGGFTPGDSTAFSDFFESLFGKTSRGGFTNSNRAQTHFNNRGEDHHAKIEIAIEDAFAGATRTITLHAPELDQQGHVITHEHNLRVKIPNGVIQGQQIRLMGQGAPGVSGGTRGDLYLQVEFVPHSFYRIEGRDLYLELPVMPWEAALGAKVTVPTPSGILALNIPKGSSSGQKLRLRGRGIPARPAGDLFVVLQIVLPPANSERAKALYRQMEKELAFNPRAKLGV